jgi:hypothetical protein
MQIESVFVVISSFCSVKRIVGIIVVRYRLNLIVSTDRVRIRVFQEHDGHQSGYGLGG